MRIPIVGPSYDMDARSFDVQRTINLYPLMTEVEGSKSVSALTRTPGLSLFAMAGGGPVRGAISSTSNRAFIVSGNGFYEIEENGTAVLIDSLETQTSRISMAENTTQIIIVDGMHGYIFNKDDDSFEKITDVNFPTSSIVSYQDGYFLTFEVGTQKFYISNLNDGTTWDPLDFTSVEASPDNINCILSDRKTVWIGGNRGVEPYSNTGNADFPFERIPGAYIPTGVASGYTFLEFDNTVIWLGTDENGRGVVWKAEGYQARRVSTQAIEIKINSSEDFTESYAWVYHQQGHIFYCLQVRGLDTTLVYDGATGQWHERMFKNPVTNGREQHRGSCHFFFGKKNLVGDRETGKVYQLSLDVYDDEGDEIIRERICPHLQDEKRLIAHSKLELDMEVGTGLTLGQGSNPKIMLQYSDDGGHTFSKELWRDIGKKGKYGTRVVWRQLGQSRDRVYKIRISDPVFVQINEAYLNAN